MSTNASEFTPTIDQRTLAGTRAEFRVIPPFEGERATAHAASIPALALVLSGLLGSGGTADPTATATEVGADVALDRGRQTSVPDLDRRPGALHELDELDELPGAALEAAALLRAWQRSCVDGRLATYRDTVLRRPAFEVFMFDRRLVHNEDGRGSALAGLIIDSDRPLAVLMSAESQGALAAEHAEERQGDDSIALVLEPGDAVAVADPTTGDAIVLARDAASGSYAWAEASWSWKQACSALQEAPVDSSWAERAVASPPPATGGDAGAAVAWLGARVREAPRRADLDPMQARRAWTAWRAEFVTGPARLLAEAQTSRLLTELEGLLDRLVPTTQELELEEVSETPANATEVADATTEVHALLERAGSLRQRIEDISMIGGTQADRSHALPRIDRKLDRVRSVLR